MNVKDVVDSYNNTWSHWLYLGYITWFGTSLTIMLFLCWLDLESTGEPSLKRLRTDDADLTVDQSQSIKVCYRFRAMYVADVRVRESTIEVSMMCWIIARPSRGEEGKHWKMWLGNNTVGRWRAPRLNSGQDSLAKDAGWSIHSCIPLPMTVAVKGFLMMMKVLKLLSSNCACQSANV